MLVDAVIAIAILVSAIIGYKNGFLRTIFKFIGYIAGGVLGIYFSLKFSHDWALDIKRIGFVIISIVAGGIIGSFAGGVLAKGLKATVVRGPLALLDSLAGSALGAIGVNQTWQNVIGSRSNGVTYTNSTGRPIQVIATNNSGSGVLSLTVSPVVNSVSLPYCSINATYSSAYVSFIVPVGQTYSVTFTGAGTQYWSELR
jgi:uncharacterized membrane protein required for colicin V production